MLSHLTNTLRRLGVLAWSGLRIIAIRIRRSYSPSGVLLSAVAALGILLALSAFVAAHYFGKDVLSSLTYSPADGWCDPSKGEGVGVHCFGDYVQVVLSAAQQNPWDSIGHVSNYLAAGMLPQWFFGNLGALFNSKSVGLFAYLAILVAALITPAIWSSKGKTISARLMTVGLFGILSVPSLMALDRGNNIALAVPALLAFLVSLRRGRYSITVIAIVIATLIKPQFVLLAFALLALRKWRHFFATIAGVVATNLLAYLIWPRDFPMTIWQTLVATLRYGGVPLTDQYPPNVSLAKGLHTTEIWVRGMFGFSTQHSFVGTHAGLASTVLLLMILGSLLVMGKRVPGHLSGILLVVCASLFVSTSWSYYLVFALCVAAVCLRDPLDMRPRRHAWRGVLDQEQGSLARKFASLTIVLATASTLMNVLLPVAAQVPGLPPTDLSRTMLLRTTIDIVPVLWLVTLAAILVAWALPERKSNSHQLRALATSTPSHPSQRAAAPEQRVPLIPHEPQGSS